MEEEKARMRSCREQEQNESKGSARLHTVFGKASNTYCSIQ